MGDAILAFWNAPLDQADHAQRACNAALAIIARVSDLNLVWRKEAETAGRSFEDVRIGVGVNSGECCVGNLGSEQLFDYTVAGDGVNVGARVESLNKEYETATSIIISETTYLAAQEVLDVRRLGEATVHEAMTIHRLLEYSPHDGGFQRDPVDEGDFR